MRCDAYRGDMSLFRIHMINSEFESREDSEFPSLEAAVRAAIVSATRVASEAIAEGSETSAVEIRIEKDEHVVAHHVVNLSVSQMLNDE